MNRTSCYHCGDDCNPYSVILYEDKSFCCQGCKTVFEIFTENELGCYYDLERAPGAIPTEIEGKYNFLDNRSIVDKLLEFKDDELEITTLYIPHIHCSSCIWILENLNKLNKHILTSQVNFGKKTIRLTYRAADISLKSVVELLSSIGYEPYISLENFVDGTSKVDRQLIYKIGVAGFAFGNVMLLSFPEYFEVNEYWLEQYKHVFRYIMFAFSLPVVFYAAQDYFISAFKGLRAKLLNIDVPIALGILVLFLRSTTEILFDLGSGFFDSLTGLVFFLLLGKFFQQRTYSFLSFERDYKSYFPIAVTRIEKDNEESIQVYDINEGDRLLIRNQELLPVDAIMIKGSGLIDYSFVTGESKPVLKTSGDKLYAGGKQVSGVIEVEALRSVEQSYLTQLWSNDVFKKDKTALFTNLTNKLSKYFTIVILSIAIISTLFWLSYDPSKAINVFTAVLIIACPCAIALSAPFTYGNLLRIFGRLKFYLKNAGVIEQLSAIDTIIFDKTGTITSNDKSTAHYEGEPLSLSEEQLLKSTLRGSNHPLSRSLYDLLGEYDIVSLNSFDERLGQGVEASSDLGTMRIGSARYVGVEVEDPEMNTSVYINSNNSVKGKFTFSNAYRTGVSKLFRSLGERYKMAVISGDNSGERKNLEKLLPAQTKLIFDQKPIDKLEYIAHHQGEGAKILMIGDGLNDAGALAQSDVGIAISENINVFSPACDAILDASNFGLIDLFLKTSKSAIKIIKWSFFFSFLYNIIGLYFAVTGRLEPVIAAILMPLSSISIVIFTTLATSIVGRRLKQKKPALT
ncbi:MAG: HAD-IC family P-type ATPase [Flavobacteriaceae bacterium]|nr:HAD-IC family P-type ATPase [Flavobacteriaceae bacterium]